MIIYFELAIPYLLLSFSFIIVYSFANWYFIYRTGRIFTIHEGLCYILYPYLYSLIPALIWSLISKTKIAFYSNYYRGGWFSLFFFSSMTIGIPNIVTQYYMDTATGKLTRLSNVSEIDANPKSKYYTIANYYIDKNQMRNSNSTSISGRHKYFNMSIFITLPILASQDSKTNIISSNWLGVEYSKQISNSGMTENDRDMAFTAFASEVQRDFDTSSFSRFTYFERINNSSDLNNFEKAIQQEGLQPIHPNFLRAGYNPFDKRADKQLNWTLASYGIGTLFVFLITLGLTINQKTIDES